MSRYICKNILFYLWGRRILIVELLSIFKKKSKITLINNWSIANIFCVVSKMWNSQFCISYWITFTVERWKKPWLHPHLQTNYIVSELWWYPAQCLEVIRINLTLSGRVDGSIGLMGLFAQPLVRHTGNKITTC